MPDAIIVREEPRAWIKCPGCLSRLEIPTLLGKALTIQSPHDVTDVLMLEMAGLSQEELRVIVLDTKNHVILVTTVYKGNVSSAQARIAELLRDAVRLGAPRVLLVHNHPSGDPTSRVLSGGL